MMVDVDCDGTGGSRAEVFANELINFILISQIWERLSWSIMDAPQRMVLPVVTAAILKMPCLCKS